MLFNLPKATIAKAYSVENMTAHVVGLELGLRIPQPICYMSKCLWKAILAAA